jgi:hypothetical protein
LGLVVPRGSLGSHPRDAIILHSSPDYGDLIERETTLVCVARSVYHKTHQTFADPDSTGPSQAARERS